ncbi:hypothetical protein [Roseivirga pacifica]|nr:hypothetical protein [Roseivirga pacifica]
MNGLPAACPIPESVCLIEFVQPWFLNPFNNSHKKPVVLGELKL